MTRPFEGGVSPRHSFAREIIVDAREGLRRARSRGAWGWPPTCSANTRGEQRNWRQYRPLHPPRRRPVAGRHWPPAKRWIVTSCNSDSSTRCPSASVHPHRVCPCVHLRRCAAGRGTHPPRCSVVGGPRSRLSCPGACAGSASPSVSPGLLARSAATYIPVDVWRDSALVHLLPDRSSSASVISSCTSRPPASEYDSP